MISLDICIPQGGFVAIEERVETLARGLILDVSDRAAKRTLSQIRSDMVSAKLGRLGNAIGAGSDKQKGTGVRRRSNGNISASGSVFIRSRSERTVGAIISYTEGAEITPKNRSGLLWFPTDEIQRIVGSGKERARMTPALYRARGFEQRFGPLIPLRSVDGTRLLAVKNVGVSEVGARGGRVRGLTRSGRARKGDRVKALSVLFIGIPRTARAARTNPRLRAAEAARQAIQELGG